MNIKYPQRKLKTKLSVKLKGIISLSIPFEARVPTQDWSPWFGTSVEERQKYGRFDTNDCWEFSTVKSIEIQLNWLYAHNRFSAEAVAFFKKYNYVDSNNFFNLSDQFYDILSGNFGNGGTAEESYQLFNKYGAIPHNMLHCTDEIANNFGSQESFDNYYYNKSNITQEMLDLGEQFKKYAYIKYQRIGKLWNTPDRTLLAAAIQMSPLSYGVPVDINTWNQVTVPKLDITAMHHEVTGYKVMQVGVGYPILDNYTPYKKVLSDGYRLSSVMQGIVFSKSDNTAIQLDFWGKVWSAVIEFFRMIGFVSPPQQAIHSAS